MSRAAVRLPPIPTPSLSIFPRMSTLPTPFAPLPTLFVAHGAPTFAREAQKPGPAGSALRQTAARIGKPQAALVVTAHWDTETPRLGGALRPDTMHDFRGFPRDLFALRYPVAGAYCAAMGARDLLNDVGLDATVDLERGLDHGAWVPLMLMYPEADVPVVPLSIQSHLGPEHHFRVGQALAPLTRQGVLIVASGNVTHNLGDFMRWYGRPGNGPAYVRPFADWIWGHIEAGDSAGLLGYRDTAPGAREAHPGDDHLLPLYVALGAASTHSRRERFFAGTYDKVLAMDGYAWWPSVN